MTYLRCLPNDLWQRKYAINPRSVRVCASNAAALKVDKCDEQLHVPQLDGAYLRARFLSADFHRRLRICNRLREYQLVTDVSDLVVIFILHYVITIFVNRSLGT